MEVVSFQYKTRLDCTACNVSEEAGLEVAAESDKCFAVAERAGVDVNDRYTLKI